MITVYVWVPTDGAWGHSSMLVTGGLPAGRIHISWWPTTPKTVRAAVGTTITGSRSINEDLDDEDGSPNYIIDVPRLNETATKFWWQQWLRDPSYYALTRNCSTTAARALEAGGALERLPPSVPHVQYGVPLVVSPLDVLRFVNQINSGLTPVYGRDEGFRRAWQRMNETLD